MNNKQNNTLNQKLRSLLKETPVYFENRDKLRELGQALTNNDFIKRTTIKKYGN